MNILQSALYWFTSGLLIPCIAFLFFMLIQSLIAVGKQFSVNRLRQNALAETISWVRSDDLAKGDLPDVCGYLACAETVTEIQKSGDIAFNRLLVTRFETEAEKYLSRFGNLAKLGPVAGLVGTLIPMGPALQGLADGNIQQLAAQMQIAFTTTVIGLIIGGIGFLLYQINKRHTLQELSLLDYILEQQEKRDENS